MLCLRVAIYSWDAWGVSQRAQGREREVTAIMLQASPYAASIATERHPACGTHASSRPRGGDRHSLSRRRRTLPVLGSPGRQFRDYLLPQSPGGAWARVSASRRKPGKWGLQEAMQLFSSLCCACASGLGPRRVGKESGGKGTGARKYYYKEQSRTTESHLALGAGPVKGYGQLASPVRPSEGFSVFSGTQTGAISLTLLALRKWGRPFFLEGKVGPEGEAGVRAPRGSTPRCRRGPAGILASPRCCRLRCAPGGTLPRGDVRARCPGKRALRASCTLRDLAVSSPAGRGASWPRFLSSAAEVPTELSGMERSRRYFVHVQND